MKKDGLSNSKLKDSSSKLIFGDATLCSQFLRGYVNIPILKNVQPEDIEDISERFVHIFTEERNADVVKKVHIEGDDMPFYLISLIEHKSRVDYNVVMQILRYMVYIWEDYEKECEAVNKGISKTKDFRYPPVLPIIYYDDKANWSASIELQDRIYLSDMMEAYIPNFKCILIQVKDYSNAQLREKEDELSILMMINKLQDATDFVDLEKELDAEYIDRIIEKSPEYLLDIMVIVTKALLMKLNVPNEEVEAFTEKIKERKMGDWVGHFKGYDVQETRRVEREKTRVETREEDIEKLIEILKELKLTKEIVVQQLAEKYELSQDEAIEKVEKYW